jgi:glycosyltransferase involved in cell wall biosynthesis
MRILQVVGGLNRGGAETWLVQVLRNVDRNRYQFDFLVHSDDPGQYDEEVRDLGCKVLPCHSHRNPARYAYNFGKIIKAYGPYDWVHSHVHWFSGYVLWLARRYGVEHRIAQAHTSSPVSERSPYVSLMRSLVHNSATHGIAVSSAAAEAYFPIDWKRDERWQVRPIGIDLTPFGNPVDRATVRADLGIPINRIVVGHVGRFVESKNHHFILKVAYRAIQSQQELLFLFIGEGALRSEVQEEATRLGLENHVLFVGLRTDVPKLMKGAMDAFIFPSVYEGFGLALVEAQAAGLPCLVSDTMPAEVDLEIGLLLRCSLTAGPELWAKQLNNIVRKERLSPDLDGLAKFSIEGSATALTQIYDRCWNGKSSDMWH